MYTVLVVAWCGVALAAPPEAGAGPTRARSTPTGKEGIVIDRIVAVVDDRVITASQVVIAKDLARRDPDAPPFLQRRRAEAPLESLVEGTLIRLYAGQTALYEPTAPEVRARLDAVKATWPDPRDYQRWLLAHGLDETHLAALLYSRMVVERVVARSIPTHGPGNDAEDYAAWHARYATWLQRLREGRQVRLIPPMNEAAP